MHHDFPSLRRAPAELRAHYLYHHVTHVVGYQPRHLMHRAHVDFIKRTSYLKDAVLLIQALVGRRGLNDADHYSRAPPECRAR